ncbi:MAG: signal transduction protein [Thermoplasmata archaeon]|nr:MAG: signal transduction protein [Thermoplasmata archaeon]
MFRDTIRGLDKLFKKDIKPPKIILVTGPPGAMKSSFVYALISKYVENTGNFALFTTLEETVESHLENMEALGIKLSMQMQISDLTDLRDMDSLLGEEEKTNYIDFIERMILHLKKTQSGKFTVFALDSLGALYSLMDDVDNLRKKMYYFFQLLRENNLIAFVMMEKSLSGDTNLLGHEGFLVDGIINLGVERSTGKIVRFLQVEKMRAVAHSMEKHALVVGVDGGIAVLGPVLSG